jgi:nicotinamidase-related amidase
VDLQRAFVEPGWRTCLPGAPAALGRALELRRAFREASRPVVFTRHAHLRPPPPGGMGSWWSSFLLEGERAAELCEGVTPSRAEPLLRKERYSAFAGTRLARLLASCGCSLLVVCGFMTHICVDTTARDAFMRGFDVVVARDACASRSRTLHEASLTCLSSAVARVLTVRELVGRLREESAR